MGVSGNGMTPAAGGGGGRYTTVLFDLFDTLVRFDRARLPSARIRGREVRSSVAALHPVAQPMLPGVTLEAFYDAFLWSYEEAERRRAADHHEIPARARLGLFYARLGFDAASIPDDLTDRLLATHMACLATAAEPVPGRHELLEWLTGRFRLAVVSNFDYTPTVQRILEDAGILDRFATVVVSDAVGWRKPRAAIFEATFHRLGVRAADCLFVGDRPEIDVAGAKGVGMDAVWLNPQRTPLPAGLPAPDFDVAGLPSLREILEGSRGGPRIPAEKIP